MTMWNAGTAVPNAAREGQRISSDALVESGLAEHTLRAGLLAIRGTTGQQVDHPLAIPGADVDSLITVAVGASAAAKVSYDTIAEFDGAIGMARISPAVPITWSPDASADWNTVTGECVVDIYGEDADGEPIHDTLSRPNGAGAAIYTTAHCFSRVRRIDQQACVGAAGTCTFGTSAARCEYGKLDALGVVNYDRGTPPATTAGYDYEVGQVAPIQKSGLVAVTTEDAVAPGDPVFVRVVVAGADLRGQFTGDLQADDASFARVLGWTWESTTPADSVGIIRIGR